MKKIVAMCGAAMASLATFAADPVIDTTALNTTVTQLGADLEGWVAALLPVLAGVAGAFLVIWLLKLAIRIVKSFGSSR